METRQAGSKPAFIGPRTVTVRALTYGPADTYGTSWKAGVFAGSLRSGRTVPVCWGHDHKSVVGSVVGHTERADGLDLEIRLADPEDVPAARMVASLLRDGHVEGVSVGFANGVTEPDPAQRGVRRFVRADLQEVSFVTAASVPGAKVLTMRSAGTQTRTVAEIFSHIDDLCSRVDTTHDRAATRKAWAHDVVGRAKRMLEHRGAAARYDEPSAAEVRMARNILGGGQTVTRRPAPKAWPLIPTFEPPESVEWRQMHFTGDEIDTRFRVPPRSTPNLPDDATAQQVAELGFDGSTFSLTRPPQKIPRDLYEAAMAHPENFPDFDPNKNYGEVR